MRVVVGTVVKPHGITGEVAVEPRTDEPQVRFAPGATVYAGPRELVVSRSRPHQGRWLVAFDRVRDRNTAEGLRGSDLQSEVDPERSPETPEEYYDRQLIGLAVRDPAGVPVGTVVAIEHPGAQDLLVVDRGGAEVRIPFVTALVPEIDLAAGHLIVVRLPGLLDPEEAEHAD